MKTGVGSSDLEQAAWFLRQMFAAELDGAEGLAVSVWVLPGKETRWFRDPDEAARFGVEQAERSDTYFGCALYRTGIEHGRGTAKDVRRVTALWADIDYGLAEAHTNMGIVGVKVWIYRGEMVPQQRIVPVDEGDIGLVEVTVTATDAAEAAVAGDAAERKEPDEVPAPVETGDEGESDAPTQEN